MSIVSSYISSRAPVFRVNVQASTFMDHILSIVAGLGVRIVIDLVGYEDHKLTGSLVGLWEGVVVQHFIKKSPKSLDPYVAYGLRVFIDFLFTESLIRLVLTFLFTGMGVVLADIAPRVWVDTGLRRSWRHLRRDLYILVHSVPSIPYFARPRTVRFSPSRAPSVITSVPPSPTVITVTTQAPTIPVPRKRPVPGSFPDYVSETDTDSSVRSPGPDYSTLAGHTHNRRPTVRTESETSYDPDEGNRSTSFSGTPTPILSEAELSNLPHIDDEDVVREVVLEDHKNESTPRPPSLKLPPTPSDSTYPIRLHVDELHEIPPPSAGLPQIPDDDEDGGNTSRHEAMLLSSYEDKSTSPLFVECPLSSPPVGRVLASSMVLAAGAQPMRVPDARHTETLELDPFAERPPDGKPAATNISATIPPPASIDDNDPSDLLLDLNNTDFVFQANNSRPPSYAQLDFALWVSNTPSASLRKNLDIWGDLNKQGGAIAEARSNEFDADVGMTDSSEERQRPNDTQHIESTAEENDQEQRSKIPSNTDVSAVHTAENPTTNMPASQPDNARSGPSATQQEDQAPTSSAPQPEATTPRKAEDMSSVSNKPTGAGSSNTQQDNADPACEGSAATQVSSANETNENKDKEHITGGGYTGAVTLTDSFPEKNSDRLDKALELRNEIAQIEKVLIKNKDCLTRPSSTISRVELSAQVEKDEAKLKSLKAKAERWYSLVSQLDENPSTTVDLSEAPAEVFMGSAQTAITACLLKNVREVVILVGDNKYGKARRSALTARLDKLKLASRVYQLGSNAVTISLPTAM